MLFYNEDTFPFRCESARMQDGDAAEIVLGFLIRLAAVGITIWPTLGCSLLLLVLRLQIRTETSPIELNYHVRRPLYDIELNDASTVGIRTEQNYHHQLKAIDT